MRIIEGGGRKPDNKNAAQSRGVFDHSIRGPACITAFHLRALIRRIRNATLCACGRCINASLPARSPPFREYT
ncbi:hypothetical protein [Pseudoxanthomonas sp. PXM02]|uniref:hypothetical protein n=1 Tax=Pseudoxanthomonas sp. PXM02 TaxID=2769294 RepID=UPI00177F112D|nr:hypothetical protein [Pseudoxanthomonas sp. PXM02]MBD9477466.1 hypothetical protein [Pseudoxanthomonas sp. PXM02]